MQWYGVLECMPAVGAALLASNELNTCHPAERASQRRSQCAPPRGGARLAARRAPMLRAAALAHLLLLECAAGTALANASAFASVGRRLEQLCYTLNLVDTYGDGYVFRAVRRATQSRALLHTNRAHRPRPYPPPPPLPRTARTLQLEWGDLDVDGFGGRGARDGHAPNRIERART